MNKMLFIVLPIVIFISGCSIAENTYTPPTEPVIIAPTSSSEETADGYKDIVKKENQDITYYANKESKKIHLPDCRYAKIMTESKVRLEKDYEALLIEGYTPCGVCKP